MRDHKATKLAEDFIFLEGAKWRDGRLWVSDVFDHKVYRLGLNGEPDHPDQRIAEDAYLLADKSVDLVTSLFINSLQIGAFISILWQLSGTQTFTARTATSAKRSGWRDTATTAK